VNKGLLALLLLVGVALAGVGANLPDIKRYLKIRSM
jgi:hypothetical protein